MAELVVGVDGGNSKTDLVLATSGGRVLSRVRGAGTLPHREGIAVTAGQLAALVRRARTEAAVRPGERISVAAYFVANLDVRAAERAALRELDRLDLAERTVVHNDTVAVLRAGITDGWGVGVVSGTGINAVGVHPSGRVARFLALGEHTGDWGGGLSVGCSALGAAVRAGDGRGPATSLRRLVPEHFGLRTAEQVALAVEAGRLPPAGLHVLAPVVFRAAEHGDAVAAAIVARLADEVVTMTTALLRRLHLLRTPTPVVLGGGTLQHGPELMLERIRAHLRSQAPHALPQVLDVPPVAGAVIEALTVAGAPDSARRRARRTLAVDV